MSHNDFQNIVNHRLNWTLLRTFLIIAEEKSISRAATRLHLTQPAVSYALQKLESQLGRVLMQRSGPNMEITPAGKQVRKIAADIKETLIRGLNPDAMDSEIRGRVRLASVSGIQSTFYDEFLVDFHREYPFIEIEVDVLPTSEIHAALSNRAVSAALSPALTLNKSFEYQLFLRQRYALYCGRHHPLYRTEEPTLENLRDINFVTFAGAHTSGALGQIEDFRRRHQLQGRVMAASASVDEVYRFIFAGFGIGCLPEHVVADEVKRGKLKRLPPVEGVADINIFLISLANRSLTKPEEIFFAALCKLARIAAP